MCILTDTFDLDTFDLDLTDALDLDLTAVRCSVIVLCNLHTREMLLSLPAADVAAHCSSVPLLCCCSAAQVQLVGLCNYWVRLHFCTLPVLLLKLLLKPLLWLGLGWVEEFKLSLSLELASLGYLGLGTLNKKNSANCPNSPLVHVFPPSLRKNGHKFELSRNTMKLMEIMEISLKSVAKLVNSQVSECS